MQIDNSIAAVVTGGASGLGRASAQALASGMRILATHLPHAIDGLAVEVVGAAR